MMRLLLAAFVACLAFTAAAAPPDAARIDELMHKSGLWNQVGTFQAQIKAGGKEARQQEKASGGAVMSDEDFAKLTAAMEAAFAPDRMRQAVALQMADQLSADEVDEVLAWLSSDLGKRFTELEERMSAAEDRTRMQREGSQLVASLPQPRRDQLKRLVAASRADELAVDTTVNMTSAIVYGVAFVIPHSDPDEAVKSVRKRAEQQRPRMTAFFRDMVLSSFASAYRDVSDEDLERYVAFNESPVGRKYNAAASKCLDHVMVQASLDLGRRLGEAVNRKPRPS